MEKLYNLHWINPIPNYFNFKDINFVHQKTSLSILLLVLALMLCSINSSHAQSFATIGTGTTSTTSTGSDPIDGYFNFFRYQVVYTAAELTAAGMPAGAVIDQLGWSVNGDYAGGNMPSYTIRMALTAATNCATHNTATLTTVRNAANYNPTVVAAGAFDMINFNTTFTWNGTSSILVDINAGSMPFTGPYGQVRTIATTTANGSRYVRCDGCGSQAASTTGTVNTTKPQVRFRYTVPTGCTGTPTGGTTASTSTAVCSGSSFTLSTTGSTSASGLTYQWQSSPNGSTWTNIAGATALTYAATQTVDTYYRLNITCTSSGLTGSSSALLVTTTACCDYTFRLTDSFGDGWNGATMQLRIGTTVIATFGPTFTGGALLNITQPLVNGTSYNLYYSAGGTFPAEVGIQILDNAGTTIYTLGAGTGTVATTLSTWTASCPIPCAGTPTGGTTTTSANPVCASTGFTLSTTGTTTGIGLTYQWQSSTNGTTWANIAGATAATYAATQTVDTYYRCTITCTASAASANSSSLLVTTANCCNHTFNLTDSWGDGWNGANIGVQTGATTIVNVGTGFTGGGTFSQTVSLTDNTAYNLVWTGGTFPTECGYTLLNTSGTTLNSFAAGGAPAAGTFYTFTAVCPVATPPNPTNITASPTCASGVTLTATGTPGTNVTWYWQGTNPTGTDNSAGANATTPLTVFSNGTYYIRAYNSVNGLWSSGSGSYNVTTVPANAATAPAIVSSNGNTACLTTNISSPTAVAGDYWQTTAAGTSTASPATTPYNGVTAGGTYYIRSLDGSGCWSAPSSLTVSVLPTPPGTVSASQIITCGGQGTLSINSAYYNDFNTTALGNATLYGNASLTGTVLQLNPNALSQNGAAVIIDPNAINSNGMTIDFDLITLGVQGADGASYSFGDDVTVGLAAQGECGSGTKLKLAFDAYTNGANTPGVYLMYNCNTLSQAPSTPGVLAYSNNVSWCGGVTRHVTISIDNAGLATVSLGGTVLFSNIALGAGYLSANKATWKHAFAARTGGVAQGHQIDNINITYGYLVSPLEYSFDNATTWGPTNTISAPAGTYNTWVRYASNPSCQFSAGSATINPFAITSGTTVSSAATPCSAASFTLSLTGATTGAGVTYQWQSSPDGIAWSNIAAATAATLTTTQTVATYYQCLVTCSGLTAASTSLQLNMGSSCQCAAYCASGATVAADEEILNVTVGTLNNSSTCATTGGAGSTLSMYSNYSGIVAAPSFTPGSTVSFSIQVGTCGGNFPSGTGIFIDYNVDGDFVDAGETVYVTAATTTGPHFVTGTFVVPSNATPGTTRMRIINAEGYSGVTLTPCLSYGYGETEDYCVSIVAFPLDAGISNLTTSSPLCAGNTNATVSALLTNSGTTAIANGAVSVTLTVTGANTGTYTLTNSGSIAYLANQTLNFTGVDLSNAGTNNLSVTLTYTGDMVAGNNTVTSTVVTQTGPASVTAIATPNVICSGGSGPIQLTATATPPTPPANANQYVFSTQTGVSLSTLTAPINLIGANVDDGVSAVTTIPFNFTFAGTTYTQFSVNTNGLMSLGATAVPNSWTNTTVGFTAYPIIMPYWDDLYTATNGVNYQVLGTAPNRQLCVQWEVTNCCTGGAPDKTFQCWLLEGTNVVEFVYGAGATVTSPSVGISSASGNFNSVTTAANTASTTAANDVNTVFPASGTAYLFSPPPHLYAWTPTTNMAASTIYNPSVSFVPAATTYTVTVTGSNGCTSTATTSVSVSNISASISSQTDVSCFGGSNADVTVVAANGATPYTYQLGTGAFQGNGFFSGLTAGTYTVTAKDANNCTYPVTVTITEPASALGGNISIQNVSCIGGANGSITVAGNGGTSPYQYKIDAGAYGASGTFSGLSAGNYAITIKDANNCTVASTETVIEPTTGVNPSAVATPILCNGGGSTVTISATGGTAPYTGTGTVSVIAGSYTYTVTDNNGCPATTSINVTEPALLTANIAGTDVLCFGNSTGAADLSVSGGTTPYSYSWNNGTLIEDLTGLVVGNYDVTVTDVNNCVTTANVTIAQPTAALSANIAGTNVLCFGNSTGAADLSVSGGTAPYNYSWNNGTLTEDLTAIAAGNYDVTVTDAHNCTTTANVTITQPTGGLFANIAGTDVLCFGNSTGAADLSVNGGTTPYSYSWNNGILIEDLTGLAAGNYDVTVTDAGSCTTTANVTIAEPSAALAANISGIDVLCFGNSTGAADLSVSGGTTPYVYSWNNGAVSQDLTGLTAGNYDVTVTDAHSCSTTANVTIAQPTATLSANIAGTNVLCFGNNTGAADLSVIGGTTPYNYSWNNGTLTEDLTAIAAGNYDVTVTDAHSCTTTANVTIAQPTGGLSANIAGTDVLCFGNSTGAADLSVNGGTTPYVYSWNNGSASQDLTGLVAGNYDVTVTDAGNCTTTANVTIAEPSAALAANISGTDVLCFGNNTGAADLSVSGGTTPYSYSWNNGTLIEDLTGLVVGNYDVTVTDVNNCVTTANVTIAQPTAALAANISGTNVLCFGNNTGAADLSVSGGTTPYVYSWNNGSTSQDLTAIAAGNYDVTVTDAHSCTTTTNVTITQPTGGLSANIAGTDVLCFGNSTGAADLSVNGGTTPYVYSWNNGATSQDLTGLAAGNYDVTVTDAGNCTTTTNVTIAEPSAALSANIAGTDVLCFGNNTGAADLSVSGGTSPYSYSWNNGAVSQDLTGLAAGNYDVTVTDAHSCSTTANVTIAQPTAALAANIAGTNVLCFGNSTGAADLSVSGGTTPYTYSWNNGTLTEDLTAIPAGNYDVTVTDAHNCTTTANVTITQPTGGLSANIAGTDVLCFGNSTGAADLSVNGGTSPYVYSWNNGSTSQDLTGLAAGNYDVTVTDAGSCTTTANVTIAEPSAALSANIAGTDVLCFGNTTGAADLSVSGGTTPYVYSWNNGAVSQDLTGLASGNYDVTVTDAHSCSTTANVTIAQPSAALSANIAGTNVLCFGNNTGAADLSVSGGTTPYTYSWNNGSTSQDLTAIAAGNYDVTVTDAHNCTTTANVTITQPTGGLSANIAGTDVLCFGNSTGAADLSVNGGTTPYVYSWNNGSISQDLTGLVAGNYDVAVTDAGNCTTTANVTIAEPSAALAANISGTDVLCFGNNTGAADLSVSGGTTPYVYSWNNGSTSQDLTGLAAGNYDVTVTDAHSCSTTANVTIAQPTAALAANISGTNVLCFGNSTGAADLSVSGGTTPYTYSWNNGTLTEDLTGLAAGNYDVTATDAHNCTTTANVTITQPTGGLSTNIAGTDVLCFGNSTGAADLSVNGGTTPYVYSWNNGATSQDLTGLAAGNYDVTVTDAGNCTTTANVTIAEPSAALSANIAGIDVLCFGNNTGAADLSVSGGTTPYSYSWNNGILTEDLTGLAVGNYDVTVTDAHSCSTTANVTITQPTAALSANIAGTNVLCFGNNTGAADLSVIGGTTPYTYSWNNGTLTEDLTAIPAGNYDVTVTDAHNCTTTANVTITQPTGGLSANIAGTDVLCFGNSTGAADLSVNGGTTPYSYSWNNGSASQDLTGLAAGNYDVTVTDAGNCTTTANVTIAEPSAALAANISGTDVLCFGNNTGAADLSVIGGTAPYAYSWNNGAVSQDLTGLASGNYDVTVTDAHSCSTTANVTIAQPTAALAANISGTNVLCFGNSTGAADLSVSGGTTPYVYSWNNGTLTEDLTAIAAGNYDVTVTDAHSCTTTANVTITQPTGGLSANIAGTDVLCFGNSTGAADLSVSGGTTPYVYSWNNGSTSQDLTGLAAGNYDVTVTDAGNCTTTANVTIAEPSAALAANISGTDVLCFGNNTGAADLSVIGGTTPYVYSWNNGSISQDLTGLAAGNYDVTVTDAHSCSTTANVTIAQPTAALAANISGTNVLCFGNNTGAADLSVSGGTAPYAYSWNNGTLTEDLTAIAAGNYDVTVTDAHNCTTTANVTITQPIGGLSANIAGTDVLCFGNNTGAADLSVNGGTTPYSYSWNNGAASQDLTGLTSGNYDVTVTDAGNCSTTANVTIAEPSAALSANISGTDVLCFGNNTGAADLSVSGGTTPYSYSWNNGSTSQDLTGLAAGNYDVIVTDAHSCSTTANITITQPTATLSANIAGTNVLCFGNSTGAADLSVSGGTAPYVYSWNNGSTSQDLTAIAAGNYDVTVTDAHNCTTTANVTITQPTGGLFANIAGTDVLCFGNSTGAADLTVIGGTTPYSYSWNNGILIEDLTGLAAGNYDVTVTDAGSCTTTANVTIAEPSAALSANISGTDVLCFGNNTGAADLSVSGGTTPYSYSWNNGILTEDLTGLAVGNYDVTVTDAHSCSTTANVTITQPTAALSANIAGTNVLCFGNSTGAADLSVSGGTAPYAYSWNNGTLTEDLTAIAAGNYDVTVTDAHNCTTTANVTITQPTGGLSANIAGTDVLCFGNSTGAADLSVNGGTTPYVYSWNNGAVSQDLTGLAAGNYDVTVTDAGNCTTTANVTIAEPSAALSANIAGTDVLCFGNSTGAADLSVSGGTTPYSYSWNNGSTSQDLTGLAAGNYDVTVTDAHSCSTTANVTIAQPTAALSANIAGTNVVCYGYNTGAADLSVSGGTSPYDYAWSNSATTEDLGSIVSGVYDVTVTDAANCITTASVTITQPVVGATVNPISNVSACPGQNIVLTFSGSAVAGTIYEWTVSNTAVGLAANGNGNINVVAPIVSGSSQVATITVTPNAGGCLGNPQTAQVTVLPKPSNPVAGLTTYCSDATMWVSTPVAGTIKWYNNNTGAGASVGIGATVPGFTSNGTYYAYEDLGGCMSDASNAVLVNVGMANHWNVIVNPVPPVTGTQVYYADAFCLDGSTGLKYYYNTAANMLLMASDYSIPAGVQLVTHTPTNATEMAVKVDIIAGYGSGTGQFVSGSTAPYVTSQFGWYVMHRTWQVEVAPVNQIPVGDTVRVKYFFSALDEFDIFNSTGNVADSFRFYKLRSGLDPSNPADHSGVDSSDIFIYDPSTVASLSTWVLGQDTVTGAKTADYYVSSFSGGGGGAGPGLNVSPLPVVLSSFKGENVGNENFLHWITEKELNTDHFDVERSSDKITYAKVGEVEANAQVNSGARKYDFIDKYPLVGSNHYRLKVVDKNGAFNYSKSIELKYMPMKISFELYPNPMKDKLNVRIDGLPKDSKVRFTIYNLLGEKVFSELWKEEGNIMKEVNVSQLAQGTYIYECVELKTGEVVKGKLTRTDL